MNHADLGELNKSRTLRLLSERGGAVLGTAALAEFQIAGDRAHSAVMNAVPNAVAEGARWVELIDHDGVVVASGPLTPSVAVDALLRRFRLAALKELDAP